MKGFTLKIPFLLPGLTVLNFVQTHIFCVASAWTSTFLQKSLLCWCLSFPTHYCGKQNCVHEPSSCLKCSRGSKHAQTPLPPAWPWNKLEQHVYLNTPKQGRQRTATAWKPHSTFSTTLSTKLNSVYPAKLSTGTQLRDYSCTASFCPHQQQKSFRKAVSHHGGNLRRADILSCGSKGVLHTKQSTHNPWPFRTASEGWFPQEQIMYNL